MKRSRYFGILVVMMFGLWCGTAYKSYALSRAAYKGFITDPENLIKPSYVTMGIMAFEPSQTLSQSKGLAIYAAVNSLRGKKSGHIQVLVFSQEQDGWAFNTYQRARRYIPLTKENYSELTNLWKNVPVCCVFSPGKKSKTEWFYPQQNPTGWWKPLLARQYPAPKIQHPK